MTKWMTTIAEGVKDRGLEELLDLIRTTVAPHTWTSTGGHIGSIGHWHAQLVVKQTEANHRAIADLLKMLRATRRHTRGTGVDAKASS